MNCPLCRGKKAFLFHNNVWSADNGEVHRCNECDVTFIHPTLDKAEETILYKDYNAYVNKRCSRAITSSKEFHEACKPVILERYLFIKDFFSKAKSILEVGSSTGGFLELLKDKECYGVEVSDDNREHSRQFAKEVYSNILKIPGDKRFDIICMFHVFEHIKNPFKFIERCKSYLVKGGIFLIEVPHIEDPLISLYDCKAYKDFYFQPIHPFVYSVNSLNYIFRRSGLKPKGVIYYQRYGLDNHLTCLSKGRSGGDKLFRSLFESNLEYKKIFQKIKKTDTIFYIAKL